MTTKEKVLELFESSRDVYLSGEDIAHKLLYPELLFGKLSKLCKTRAMRLML